MAGALFLMLKRCTGSLFVTGALFSITFGGRRAKIGGERNSNLFIQNASAKPGFLALRNGRSNLCFMVGSRTGHLSIGESNWAIFQSNLKVRHSFQGFKEVWQICFIFKTLDLCRSCIVRGIYAL